ncbi:MAG: cell division protein FtsA [Prevotella sp.]|nr:cell division protein FtsA [Prevotella sp.]
MPANEFIVAIELGSSKITGVAGTKNNDGSVNVYAVVKENASQCIRKGVVNNIDKTAQCLTSIISKLSKHMKREITQVYVGVGGQSIRSVRNEIVKEMADETIISQSMTDEMKDSNRNMVYPDLEILYAETQEYNVDKQVQIDPEGMKARRLQANFLNILCRKAFYSNLNNCFDKATITIAEMFLSPRALADAVLSEAEKRSGCVLVDLGADTTTVMVYHKNILRHMAVIPLGGNNITKDIASLQMEEADAEKMKFKYGVAYTDNKDIDTSLNYSIDESRTIESKKFIEIVEGRLDEIIENVWNQVPSIYVDKLLGGFILTGGGSNMKNIEKAFRIHTHIEKVRVAKFVNATVTSSNSDITAHDGTMNTVLGLLIKGENNCAGQELNQNPTIFNDTVSVQQNRTTADVHTGARTPGELEGKGIVMTQAEKDKAEDERRKREEAERQRIADEEERERKEAEERRKNSFFNKMVRGIKNFGKSMMEPDE